jgi:hypothetical protein
MSKSKDWWHQKRFPHKNIFDAFLRKSHSPMEPLLWLIQVQKDGSKNVTHAKNVFDAFLDNFLNGAGFEIS